MSREVVISVIMSVYNERLDWLKESIESILYQTYKDFEFIIVLDNPKNLEAKKTLQEYSEKDSRIKLIYNDINIGLPKSLNKALCSARGDYIARMDADDISEVQRLNKQLRFMIDNPDVALIGTEIRVIDEEGNFIRCPKKLYSHEAIKKFASYGNPITHPTWFGRRELFEKLKGYRNFKNSEDMDFMCRIIAENYVVLNMNECLLKYRVRLNSQSVAKGLLQMKYGQYISKLYKQRKKNGNDLYDENYVDNISVSVKEAERFSEGMLNLNQAYQLFVNKQYLKSITYFSMAIFKSRYISKKLISQIMLRVLSTL
ncbi:glycosyltransferase involved in cell wall biosynthesis [Bacillus fengqiuensis]|nr:glycosyltransferase involved in cell wall biosynthesis [Bacillus fengqiuensis]